MPKTSRVLRRVPPSGLLWGRLWPLTFLVLIGCQALTSNQSGAGERSAWKWWEREEERESIDGMNGPLQRVLDARMRERESMQRLQPSPEALADYEAAERLYKDGQYQDAEKSFDAIVKRYKPSSWQSTFGLSSEEVYDPESGTMKTETGWNLFKRDKNTRVGTDPVVEDALFMRAECQFEQKRYAKAQDSYGELMKEYPSTRYLDVSTQRLFRIAQIWLQFPEIVKSSDVQQVNMEEPKTTPAPPDTRPTNYDPTLIVPILPNLHNRTRPVFDTEGRALEALKQIWLNDPTGPLADDALMMTASHHLREGNYLEADHTYAILREQYPKSTHLENAFLLGSHTQLMSYQGPSYDGTSLEGSRRLKESLLRLYPNHPERERLLEEIRKIDDAAAAREWETVVFWQKKRKPQSVAACCREVIRLYPNSSYAAQARTLLADIEGKNAPPAPSGGGDNEPQLLPVPGQSPSAAQGAGRAGL